MHVRTLVLPLAAAALTIRCVSAPRVSRESERIARNPVAVVEGRVRDERGDPVAGVLVQALPRAEHLPWSPAARTDAGGHFALRVYAPGEYGFLISKDGVTIVTSDRRDPAREHVRVEPGERREGIELLYLERERDSIERHRVE